MSYRPAVLARICVPLVPLLFLVPQVAGARQLKSKPAVYTATNDKVTAGKIKVGLVLVTPVKPKPQTVLVLFASGDGGLHGVSKTTLQHLADLGYYVAGFSSREALKSGVKGPNGLFTREVALESVTSLIEQAKRGLKLPDTTPMIVTGMSRGANLVIAAAGAPTLRSGIIGGVAMALTRETDYIDLPDGAGKLAGVELDKNGQVQMYPAIERLGSIPLAIIQSTNDKYVKSAESRAMLGPDTPTRRLYEVKSSGHSFGDGEDVMLRNLDDALQWITSRR